MDRAQAILSIPQSICTTADIARWLRSVGIVAPYQTIANSKGPVQRILRKGGYKKGLAISRDSLLKIAEQVSRENFVSWLEQRQELSDKLTFGHVVMLRKFSRAPNSRCRIVIERDPELIQRSVEGLLIWVATETFGGYERILRIEGEVYATLDREEAELWDLSMCRHRTGIHMFEEPSVVWERSESGVFKNKGFTIPGALLRVTRKSVSIAKVNHELICPGVEAPLVFDANSWAAWRIVKEKIKAAEKDEFLVPVRWGSGNRVRPVTLDLIPLSRPKRYEKLREVAQVVSKKEVMYRRPNATPP